MGFWKNFWEMLGPDTNGESGSGENKYKYINMVNINSNITLKTIIIRVTFYTIEYV